MTEDYFAELEDWRAKVGAAILAFGEIELITLKCLELLPNDPILKSTSSLGLGQRIDLLLELLNPRREEPTIAELLRLFASAKEYLKYRNILAHSPLMAEIYEHQDTGELKVEQLITSVRGGKRSVDLAKVTEVAETVEQIASDLWIALSNLTGKSVLGT